MGSNKHGFGAEEIIRKVRQADVELSQGKTVLEICRELGISDALVISRRYLAAPLNQGAVGIKEKLGVVQGSAVTLVDADGHNNSRLLASLADGVGGGRRHRHRLVEQLQVLTSGNDLVGGLEEKYG